MLQGLIKIIQTRENTSQNTHNMKRISPVTEKTRHENMLPWENWRIWKLNFFSSCLYHEILAFLPLFGLNSSWNCLLSSHYHCLPRQISLAFPLCRVLRLILYLRHLFGFLLVEKGPFLRSFWLLQRGLKFAFQSVTNQSVWPACHAHSAQSSPAMRCSLCMWSWWMHDVFSDIFRLSKVISSVY